LLTAQVVCPETSKMNIERIRRNFANFGNNMAANRWDSTS
jgi:hypothetical protein